jgi:hypothetical protein
MTNEEIIRRAVVDFQNRFIEAREVSGDSGDRSAVPRRVEIDAAPGHIALDLRFDEPKQFTVAVRSTEDGAGVEVITDRSEILAQDTERDYASADDPVTRLANRLQAIVERATGIAPRVADC